MDLNNRKMTNHPPSPGKIIFNGQVTGTLLTVMELRSKTIYLAFDEDVRNERTFDVREEKPRCCFFGNKYTVISRGHITPQHLT